MLAFLAIAIFAQHPAFPASLAGWDVCSSDAGSLVVMKGDGVGRRVIAKDAHLPKLSPDRRRIVFARDDGAYVIGVDGRGEKRILKTPSRLSGLSWGKSLMGERDYEHADYWKSALSSILVTYDDDQIRLIRESKDGFDEAEDFGGVINPIGKALLYCPAISPNGKKIAISVNGDVWLAELGKDNDGWDFTRIAALAEYDQPSYRASRENYLVTDLDWSPDGKSLAYCKRRVSGSGFQQIGLLTPKKARPWEWEFRILNDHGLSVAFSPDGKWLYCEGADSFHAQSILTKADLLVLSYKW